MAHSGEDGLNRVGGAQMHPVIGGEVEDGQQGLAILLKLPGGLGVLAFISADEAIDGFVCHLPGRCHPDCLQISLSLALP